MNKLILTLALISGPALAGGEEEYHTPEPIKKAIQEMEKEVKAIPRIEKKHTVFATLHTAKQTIYKDCFIIKRPTIHPGVMYMHTSGSYKAIGGIGLTKDMPLTVGVGYSF